MIEITFRINELHCLRQYDGGGPSEPYVWVLFFWIDTQTISGGPENIVATDNIRSDISGRNILEKNVRPGKVITVPEYLGSKHLILEDGPIVSTPAVGVVFAVLEDNGTWDALMILGHQVFGREFHREINDYINMHLPNPQAPSEEERQAMADRIKDRVTSAIHDASSLGDYFRGRDFMIGSNAVFFPWSALTLLRDSTPGQPYIFAEAVRSVRTIPQPGNLPPIHAVDEYEVWGDITVRPYTPPGPDPCQAEKEAIYAADHTLRDLEAQLSRLQQELQQASGTERTPILDEIAEVREDIRNARAEIDLLREAYRRCRLLHQPQRGGTRR